MLTRNPARNANGGAAMGETVRLRAADGFEPSAYVARPAGAPKGALVLIQEIFGVNGHIRRVAEGFAADGYLAIAPALFDRIRPGITLGYSQEEIQEGIALKGQSSTENALADIGAARDFVKEAGPVGVIGYCWGGFLLWRRHRYGCGRIAEMPGADAFRREGSRHSAFRCREGEGGPCEGRRDPRLSGRPRLQLRRARK